MSYVSIRKTLLAAAINSVNDYNITNGDNIGIGFENSNFDPSGLDCFVICYIIPTTNESLGKTAQSIIDTRGILQLSVFVAKDKNYDIKQLEVCDHLASSFRGNKNISAIHIESATITAGRDEDAWFVRDMSVNFITLV